MHTLVRPVGVLLLLGCTVAIAAEPPATQPDPEAQAAKVVALLLETQGVVRWPVDDARAKLLLHAFIAHLDPHKLIFWQSDWAEFQEQEKLLDDQIKAQDLSFVKRVFERFHSRAAVAHQLALQASEQKHDWTSDEAWPFAYTDYAADKAALAERWRLRLKGEILFEKANESSLESAVAFLRQRYETSDLHRRCLTEDYLQSTLIDQLCKTCDPRQLYLSPEETLIFNDRLLRGPKYRLNLLLQAHQDRPSIRPTVNYYKIQKLPTLRLADYPDLYGWDLVAIRAPGGQTHHLVGIQNYEPWALQRAIVAVGNSPEVILELQHPRTMLRKSVAWQQADNQGRLSVFAVLPALSPRPPEPTAK